MSQTTQQSLETAPSGTTTSWRNPDSGNYGTITPQPAYQSSGGGYCREFQQTVTVGGRQESAYGTACRQPDGTWKVVSG
jgi:surface antigen